jgi:hypothetical protein
MSRAQASGLTPGLTAGLTPGLTLVAVKSSPVCAWCGCTLVTPRRNQRYCTRSHRQLDYEARRDSAAGACYLALVGLTLRGTVRWDELPPPERVADAFDCVPARRWGRLMTRLGLRWDGRAKAWVTIT